MYRRSAYWWLPKLAELGSGNDSCRPLLPSVADDKEKLVVEVVADQEATIGMLQANGFVPEALLTDHIRDRQGQLRDLMVLSCRATELAGDLELLGVADSLAE